MEIIALGFILNFIGIAGIIMNRTSLIHMLMSIELMLLAVSIIIVSISNVIDDSMGTLFALLILGVAGAESAIGLAILISYYRTKGTLSLYKN